MHYVKAVAWHCRGEDEELITVEPEDNSLSLVYRDKESLRSRFFFTSSQFLGFLSAMIGCRFVKYVSEQVRSIDGFHDLSATYYE